jgi:hypothetical protein
MAGAPKHKLIIIQKKRAVPIGQLFFRTSKGNKSGIYSIVDFFKFATINQSKSIMLKQFSSSELTMKSWKAARRRTNQICRYWPPFSLPPSWHLSLALFTVFF